MLKGKKRVRFESSLISESVKTGRKEPPETVSIIWESKKLVIMVGGFGRGEI